MPKAIALDGEKPRRRRAGSAAVEATARRGLAMRILLYSPKDLIAGAIAFVAVAAIIANAMFMQAGRHPSPMFGGSITMSIAPSTSPLPRPRPLEADTRPPEARAFEARTFETKTLETKPVESRPVEARSVEAKSFEPRLADAPVHPVKAPSGSAAASASVPRPPAPIPTSRNDSVGDLITGSHRVASVQRALTEYGYGQLKPTGTAGSDTQAAIQKFERDRKLPITGQISERLVRELAAVTGRSID